MTIKKIFYLRKMKKLYKFTKKILNSAPLEEKCGDVENDIYAELTNLKSDLERYFYSLEGGGIINDGN